MTFAASPARSTEEFRLEDHVRLVQTPRFDDARGSLMSLEFEQLPFIPRRAFVVRDVPAGTIRGCHSHRKQRQLLICLAGTIEIEARLHRHQQSIVLDKPNVGLLIEPGIWISVRFGAGDSILLVLASGKYDAKDNVEEVVIE